MAAVMSLGKILCSSLTNSNTTALITFVVCLGIFGSNEVVIRRLARVSALKLLSIAISDLCLRYALASAGILTGPVIAESLEVRSALTGKAVFQVRVVVGFNLCEDGPILPVLSGMMGYFAW